MPAVTVRDLIDFALAAIILGVGLFRERLKNALAIVAFAEPPIGRDIVAWLDFLIVVPVMLFAGRSLATNGGG